VALHGRWTLAALLAVLGVLAASTGAASASAAEFGIVPGGFTAKMLDAEGNPDTLAGSHPDRLEVGFALDVKGTGTTVREVLTDMPPGFGGDPRAVPECPRQLGVEGKECPPESQVGVARLSAPEASDIELPIFLLQPEPGQLLAFTSKPNVEVSITMELRSDDLGITLRTDNPNQLEFSNGHLELWGVPADHQVGTDIPRRPMLTAPSRCGPLRFGLRVRSWQDGAPWQSASAETAPLTDCESLAFAPGLGLSLSNPVADSPTGMRVELSLPQDEDASARSSAQIKDVTITMPAGITVSPGGAAGLTACSDAQFGLEDATAVRCPPSSRVGAVEFASPGLREPLAGTIYLGQERPGERFRMLVAAPGFGAILKFAGTLSPAPATGLVSATLEGLPEIAIERLSVSFGGGSSALLASPLRCGRVTARARLTPYGDGAPADISASASIASSSFACAPPPFEPQLSVASSSSRAGKPTTFSTTLRRRDGEQLPRRFSVVLPAGLSAALGKVTACPDADLARAACPAASRVGAARASIGSGPSPASLAGEVFATGPYRRAPFGMAIVFDGALGPFDLGPVSFRAKAEVDERTGRVTIATDPLPALVEGVPIRFQAIELDMDRPGLVRNPTSCAPRSVEAVAEAQGGGLAALASPFPLKGCDKLGFAPRARVTLDADGGSGADAKSSLRLSLHLPQGNTNLRSMSMWLPKALTLGIGGVTAICSHRDALKAACPAAARIGAASARSALLEEPLKGSVYVAQPEGNGPPDLAVSLTAGGVHVGIEGETSQRDGHFVTRLAGLPDMPLSSLVMHLGSVGKGALSLRGGACAHGRPRQLAAALRMKGQNGLRRSIRQPIEVRAHCRVPAS
jgi:hypothetical protein